MRRSTTLPPFILLAWALTVSATAQTGIGQWRDHLQYSHTSALLEAEGSIWCATGSALFKYDEQSGETERYTKVNALSDVNIVSIGWNAQRHALLAGYKNGNLDILMGGKAVNLSDIKRSSIVGDKGVYCIADQGDLAYLGCGFGIVVVDLARMEVKDTWIIGPNAGQLQVNGIAFHDDSIYAATQAGLYAAWQGETNLAAYSNWHKRTDVPGASGAFSSIVEFNGKLMVNRRYSVVEQDDLDTIYYFDAGWHVMHVPQSDFNRNLRVSPDGQLLVVTGRQTVRWFGTDLTFLDYAFSIGNMGINPMDAISRTGGGVWIASNGHGLVDFRGSNNYALHSPNGPGNTSCYRMSSAKGSLYVTTGAPSSNWGDSFNKDGVHYLVDNVWNTTDQSNDPLYQTGANGYGGGLNDVMPVQVDPQDGSHAFVGSWDDGLLEMRDGHIAGFYGAANSTLQRFQNATTDDVPTSVGGLAYDKNNNLWVTNSNCISPISVRLKNGSWHSFNPGAALAGNTLMSDIIVGDNGYKWIIRPRSAGLFVFNDNGTPTDPSDDQTKVLTTFEGQGLLPSMDVFSIAEDRDNQIWVGTGKGVAVFYNPDAVFSGSGFDAQQILITQDGNVQILLETEAVNAIAVDGANRKWLGTESSGVFLVSADGTQQLEHFTAENSPLPSDAINCLSIDGATGEVFIGTDQGIMGYRGTATEGSLTEDCATVFPNPVRDTFTGPVAITGLAKDSDVRITDVAGNLVYHTTSEGGQAIWPATDMSGNRVATGVYLVLAMDPTGANTCNTKVAVVH